MPQFLKTVDFGPRTERVVRVNSAESGLLSLDVEAVFGGASFPDALMMPKVENEDHLRMVGLNLCSCRRSFRGQKPLSSLGIYITIYAPNFLTFPYMVIITGFNPLCV